MIETLVIAAAAGAAIYWWMQPTYNRDGVIRFKDGARAKILAALNNTVPVPTIQPAFANSSTFQITRFNAQSANSTFLIESAKGAGFPVAVSINILQVIASPTEQPAFIVTMQRGEEKNVCAPGKGFALVAD